MILYFSGTGNSEYVAKRIGKETGDEVFNLFEKIRDNDFSEINAKSPWVVVVPTYAWRIPRIVEKWLLNTSLTGNRNIFFVMTCGGDIGNAGKYLKILCAKKKMKYRGCMEILMPENYIALFSAPSKKTALEIIEKSETKIEEAVSCIKNKRAFQEPAVTLLGKINSGLVNVLFYPLFVHAKKFYATDACISCGKCVKVCPYKNIHLEKKKPVWGKVCTHCMACISYCPEKAIEYGKNSAEKERYICPKNVE